MAQTNNNTSNCQVQLHWIGNKNGIVVSKDINGVIHIGSKLTESKETINWTSEYLFLGALSSSFMKTFFHYTESLDIPIFNFNCNVIGEIEYIDGISLFKKINLYPKVYISDKALKEKVNTALEKTYQNSLIAIAINTSISYHSEILVESYSIFANQNLYKAS